MPSNTKSANDAISRFTVEHRVRWCDVDASGFLGVDALVRKMEETEYAFLRSRGLSVVLTDGRGLVGFPRLAVEVKIVQPATFDDLLTVELALTVLDGKSITYEFVVSGHEQKEMASGKFQVACCRFPKDASMFAILTPDYVIQALTKPGGYPSQIDSDR